MCCVEVDEKTAAGAQLATYGDIECERTKGDRDVQWREKHGGADSMRNDSSVSCPTSWTI